MPSAATVPAPPTALQYMWNLRSRLFQGSLGGWGRAGCLRAIHNQRYCTGTVGEHGRCRGEDEEPRRRLQFVQALAGCRCSR